VYRGITVGATIDSDSNRTRTYSGENLRPLSPVDLNGSRHPSTRDWSLDWVRRARINAGWLDSIDVPLDEPTEAYELDIYASNAYATVLRTLATSVPSATYTSAQQTADFGGDQGTLYLRVYQISSRVGRGRALTVEITRD
jgi:hypothetical protein